MRRLAGGYKGKIPGNANLGLAGWGVMREKGDSEDKKDAILENGVPRERNRGVSGWHSRGYLPHFESDEAIQHVTFHLADSVAKSVIERIDRELRIVGDGERKRANLEIGDPEGKRRAEKRKRLDEWIDAGHGSCVLREPVIAEMVQESLLSFDGERYRLLAWVVMPNHVHVLFKPLNGWTVAKIVASWKKFTARGICDWRRANGEEATAAGTARRQSGDWRSQEKERDQSGDWRSRRVWHREYWDRYIRDGKHFRQVIEYIHMNPVKAGLVRSETEWLWSSAYFGKSGNTKDWNLGKSRGANLEIGVPGGVPRRKT